MYCRNCGNQLSDNAIFCAKCGTKVESLSSPMRQTVGQTVITYDHTQYNANNVSTTVSYKEVMKVVQIILSVVLSVFVLLHIIAFFLPIESGESDSFFSSLQDGEDFGAYWYGLLSSTISPLLILGCYRRERKGNKNKGIGYIGVIIVALIIMVLNIVVINDYKIYYDEHSWISEWKEYRGAGLTLYSVCCVWIPIISVSKLVIDIIRLLVENLVTVGWQCVKCGRYHKEEVGMCECGNSKSDNKQMNT